MNNQFDQNTVKQRPRGASMDGNEDGDVDVIDLSEYVNILLSYKKLISFCGLGALILGIAIAFLSSPLYRVDVLLHVQEKESAMGMGVLGVLSGGGGSGVSAEIEILKSRAISIATINALSLDIEVSPVYFPVIGEIFSRYYRDTGAVSDPWLGMDSYAWGGEVIIVDQLNVSPNLLGKELMLIVMGPDNYRLLDQGGNKLLDGKVGELVSSDDIIMFVSKMRARVKTKFLVIKNSLVKATKQFDKKLEIKEKTKGSGVLSVLYFGKNKYRITTVLNTLVDLYVDRKVKQRSSEAQDSLSFLERRLPDLKDQMESSAKAYQEYRIKHGSVNLEFETRSILETIISLDHELLKAQQERDGYRQRFKENHPMIMGLDKKIESIKDARRKLDENSARLPNTQREVLQLEQNLMMNNLLYTKLVNRIQELHLVQAGSVGNVNVIDYAMIPDKSNKPHKIQIVFIALIVGLLLGALYSFIHSFFKAGVKSAGVIEKKIKKPVLATVFKTNVQRENEKFLLAGHTEDPAFESLSEIKVMLHFELLKAVNNIVMVTGITEDFGISFISANLSGVMSEGNKTVVLVDLNVRNENLNDIFGASCEKGFADMVLGTAEIEDVIQRTGAEKVSYIASGTYSSNVVDLFLDKRFKKILNALSERYDYVVLSAAPVLSANDAKIIGEYTGTNLLVVKSDFHRLPQIIQGVHQLSSFGVEVDGIILNEVSLS